MKQIEITLNDDTQQAEIDFFVRQIIEMADKFGMTVVIIYHDTNPMPEVLTQEQEKAKLTEEYDKENRPELYE